MRQKKEQFRSVAVFPCKLRIMKEHIYMSRSVAFVIRQGNVVDPGSVQWIQFRILICIRIKEGKDDQQRKEK